MELLSVWDSSLRDRRSYKAVIHETPLKEQIIVFDKSKADVIIELNHSSQYPGGCHYDKPET